MNPHAEKVHIWVNAKKAYDPRCPHHPFTSAIPVTGHLQCPACGFVVETCCEGGICEWT